MRSRREIAIAKQDVRLVQEEVTDSDQACKDIFAMFQRKDAVGVAVGYVEK